MFIRLNKLEEARQYLNKGLSISLFVGTKDHTRELYNTLSKLDSMVGNYQQALVSYKLYTLYKDSVLNEITSLELTRLQTKYDAEKNEKRILQLENEQLQFKKEKQIDSFLIAAKQNSLAIIQAQNLSLENQKKLQDLQIEKDKAEFIAQKAETDKKQEELTIVNKEKSIQSLQAKKQRQAKNYFIAGLLLFAVLSFFIYRTYHTKQKLKLLSLRNKIASDLHDDVGSTLSSINIFSQMAQEQSKETIPMLETIGESSRRMLDAMADIVWTIKPENDQFEHIILRMKNFAYELLGAKKIDFEFLADDEVEKINVPMEVRKNLYLIFKEATNNMVKYANADKAMFAIKGEKNNLTMLITDNGQGFDLNRLPEGNGLKNMKRRALEIGANLTIESFPGNGTKIQLSVAV